MRFDQQTECIHPTDVSENIWKSRNSRSGMLSTKIGLDMRNQSKKGLAQCESHRNLRPQTFTLCEKSPVRHTIMKWKKNTSKTIAVRWFWLHVPHLETTRNLVPSGVIKHGVLENPRTEWKCYPENHLFFIVYFPENHV